MKTVELNEMVVIRTAKLSDLKEGDVFTYNDPTKDESPYGYHIVSSAGTNYVHCLVVETASTSFNGLRKESIDRQRTPDKKMYLVELHKTGFRYLTEVEKSVSVDGVKYKLVR